MVVRPNNILILIPARYASTRFPGKPLAKIRDDLSMIQMVYQNCQALFSSNSKSSLTGEVAVVTDDQRIEDHLVSFGGRVFRVDDDVPSGTERIALAYQRNFNNKDYDLVINVQGDEPLLMAADLAKLVEYHLNNDVSIATMLYRKSMSDSSFVDPNRVKVVWSEFSGRCHYFSRAAIPYNRDRQEDLNWFLHIGVYSYRPESLIQFVSLSPCSLESIEKLEQLRALENGMSIGAVEIESLLIGVDIPEDLKKVKGVLDGSHK